jgi:hypothetical protein
MAAHAQCHHQPNIQPKLAATFHAQASTGSNCLNYHMPHTTYALFKAIRSHQFPRPSLAQCAHGVPNACNLCHLDKTLGWTQDWLTKRSGKNPLP